MTRFEHVLAVVPVRDIDVSRAWYSALFGREPDNAPMPTLVEWRVTDAGWVQVTVDAERAGSALCNLAVADLDDATRELRERGLAHEDVVEANKGVRLCPIDDPDGNRIHLLGGFRVRY